jgi:decaprenylphospho-beta-D-ribofuranose 2-oxidase
LKELAERRELGGWGRRPLSAGDVLRPGTTAEAAGILARAGAEGRHVVARGLGRSYGDAAQLAGGLVIDLTGCDRLVSLDAARGVAVLEGGVSLDALLAAIVPKGYFVPVTPGTRAVTVGGAVAADVHGKNHHRDGSLARSVTSIRLATPSGERRAGSSKNDDSELFWATLGGMGLTGFVLEATLELVPIETSRMSVDTDRTGDLDGCMALMSDRDTQYRYSVAWVDCLSRGRALGRSVVTQANHAGLGELAATSHGPVDPLSYAPRQLLSLPPAAAAVRLARRSVVTAFNEVWFRKAPRHRRGELQTIASYFYPLDAVGGWNLLYGRSGFVQYQFVVPFAAHDVVKKVIETLASRRVPSLLAVLKRFGPRAPGPLSFPIEGWTLALDLPVGFDGLAELLDGFDEKVVAAGGRVYLAKDGRLHPRQLEAMYPDLPAFAEVRARVDPDGILSSDLARRLEMVAVA